MKSRLFKSWMSDKARQVTSIEWYVSLPENIEKEIIRIDEQAFGDLYAECTEADLWLEPGIKKADWIRRLATSKLGQFKQGHHHIATISIDDKIVGFVMCAPVKPRGSDLKNDVFVSLLAVKPLRDFNGEKLRVGLGRQLMESLMQRFEDGNTIILDTRTMNKPALEFYHNLGFKALGNAPLVYVNLEKNLPLPKFI